MPGQPPPLHEHALTPSSAAASAPAGAAPPQAAPDSVLVVGGDVGGTGTRVVVADAAGRVRGRGTGPGGNPTTHGMQAATASMRTALGQALAAVDPAAVVAAVFGMAGGGALRDPAAGAAYHDVFAGAGITVAPRMTGDALVAFCSATPAADGIILLAGTGAAAAAVHDHALARTADGLGWLLGDAGSGFWMGREAVRATISVVEAGAARGALAGEVISTMLDDAPADPIVLRDELIRAANAHAPVELSRLAPIVTRAADEGDAVAADICARAAGELMASIEHIAGDVPADAPVVLNGGVVRDPSSPVGAHLRELLRARFTGDVLIPRDGTLGAAWLALRDALGPGGDPARLERLHDALMTDPTTAG